jgi:hypothetical protein
MLFRPLEKDFTIVTAALATTYLLAMRFRMGSAAHSVERAGQRSLSPRG